MSGFDQHDRKHQDWLLRFVAAQPDLDGFYATQDIADLLQGCPASGISAVIERYRMAKKALTRPGFLSWLRSQREKNGINVEPWWQDAEDRARLKELK
jgi:hypothetical protein